MIAQAAAPNDDVLRSPDHQAPAGVPAGLVGTWEAASRSAVDATGAILVDFTAIVFENGDTVEFVPAREGSSRVFQVVAAPAEPLCDSGPSTFLVIFEKEPGRLVIESHDAIEAPAAPTGETVPEASGDGHCASYLYER